MSICVAYTVVAGGKQTSDYVARFCSTCNNFPPGVKADFVAICNGGKPSHEQEAMLSTINAKMFVNSNVGWDIGGHMRASKGPLYNYDLVLYLGESCYFHRAGWLKRIADAKAKHGHGMFGVWGSHVLRAHLHTTAFATCPRMLIEYPLPVVDRTSRLEFEHGERAYWRMVHKRKMPVKLVTWDGEFSPGQWRLPKDVLWKGTQSNCLFYSNHTEQWAKADAKRKRSWQMSADRAFK